MSIVTFVERKGNEIIAYRGALRQFSGENGHEILLRKKIIDLMTRNIQSSKPENPIFKEA